jgi:hypothetical protein
MSHSPNKAPSADAGNNKLKMTPDSKTETPQRVGPVAPLFGVFVRAGTMNVSGEETIGCAISMTEDALRAAPRLPFYRRVTVLAVDDYAALEKHVAETLANRHGYTVIGEPAMIYRGDAAAVLAALGLSPNVDVSHAHRTSTEARALNPSAKSKGQP